MLDTISTNVKIVEYQLALEHLKQTSKILDKKGWGNRMQKITIKNLGAIRELIIEIQKFNLLIGEQATGKSTVAKCIYYFQSVKTVLADYLCEKYEEISYNNQLITTGSFKNSLRTNLKTMFINLFGYSWELDERLYLKYEYTSDIWITIDLSVAAGKKYNIKFSRHLQDAVKNLEMKVRELQGGTERARTTLDFSSRERLRNYEIIGQEVNKLFKNEQETYYIPAGRSMITLLSNNRSNIDNANLDFITRKFMQLIETIHKDFENGIAKAHLHYPDGNRKFDVEKVSQWLVTNLKADYRYMGAGKEYLYLFNQADSQRQIPINFASSGQQEILWVLNQLYILLLKGENAFVIIEEPEAHLYPKLQDEIVNFISFFANITGSTVFMTTHSPYILMSVNALYTAGDLLIHHPEQKKAVYEIIGNKREISPESFLAGKLKGNGGMEDIMDRKMNEIRTEEIDEISDSINGKYMKLFALSESLGRSENV